VERRDVRLDDLPPAMRVQVEAKLGEQPKRRTKGNRATGVATDGWCFECRTHWTSCAAWERHSVAEGHRRFELDPSGFYGMREGA
jgi:hypothetical protein